ncbi:MAG TPA: adenylate kinase [Chloroflexi bacterium]|nr:adenylate kinase [Chloroflexota bacterium]
MRVNVIGTSGSGKTTFGRQLAEILNIPFIEMDAIFWGPNWKPLGDKVLFSRLAEALEGDRWVLDGNYSRTTPIKWQQVEVVLWLDFSFPRTLWQAVSRAIQRLISKEELWPGTGNRETLQMLFSKESIVLWTITSYRRKRKNIIRMMAAPEFQHIRFHRLRSPEETAAYLNAVLQDPAAYYAGEVATG